MRDSEEKDYPRWVGDISFDPELDNVDFRICHGEENIMQYFNFVQGFQYKREKKAIYEIFKNKIETFPDKSATGLIRIRFIVNCSGLTGRFRVLSCDENYKEKKFSDRVINQLLKVTKSLQGWQVLSLDGQPRDYYQYLIFKILSKSCHKQKLLINLLDYNCFIMARFRIKTQFNCEQYKLKGDNLRYQACMKAEGIKKHYQFSKEYQQILDEVIDIDPSFDFAYRRKSVAYLKSGDFITWKILIDKAVGLNPKEHLGARAWCRYSWFRDYLGTIDDIKILRKHLTSDIGYTTNGLYHLEFVNALCYKATGNIDRAYSLMSSLIKKENYRIRKYDYYHFGIINFQKEKYKQAVKYFLLQKEIRDISELDYYLSLSYLETGDSKLALHHIDLAIKKYQSQIIIREDYNHNIDKVFYSDILRLKQNVQNEYKE